MPRLDVLSSPVSSRLSHPPLAAGLTVARPAWFRVPCPRGRTLTEVELEEFKLPADVIAQWLAESGARHRLEFRLGTSGQHGGFWFGVAGVGVTPREAARVHRAAVDHLQQAFDSFRWCPKPGTPPGLPRHSVGLQARHPLRSRGRLEITRGALSHVARKGAPLVLQVQVDLSRARPALIRQAHQLRQIAQACDERNDWQRQVAQPTVASEAEHRLCRLIDEAASPRLRIRLYSRRLPGKLALRMLADGMSADLASSLSWGPESPPLEAGMNTVGSLVGLMAV
jgi:hypothetical protein